MKRSFFITSMLICAMMLATPASAQEENGFQKFNVVENFADNGFQWFRDAQLLAAGSKDDGSHSPGANAMTIGWGSIGTLWQRTALTVYVAEKRYTKEFMDQNEYFTLHTAYTKNGAPYYTEATMVIECKTMYAAPFDPQYFKSDVPKNMYRHFPAGIHTMYIGEVVNAWKK